jgi:hypothetical protein
MVDRISSTRIMYVFMRVQEGEKTEKGEES